MLCRLTVLCLLQSALSTDVTGGEEFATVCSDDEPALKLLQRKRKLVIGDEPGTKARIVKTATKAICFEGGGHLAMSDYAGVMAGLLAVLKKSTAGRVALTHLLSIFDVFSSNSGGTWYSGLLAYSRKFRMLQEAMAESNTRAGELWNDEIFSKEGIVSALSGKSWWKNNEEIQVRSGDLGRHTSLGNTTAMEDWALQKLWLISISIPTGSKIKPIQVSKSSNYYLVSERTHLPAFIPGVINLRLNSETATAKAPFPLCGMAATSDCWGLKMVRSSEGRKATKCSKYSTLPELHPYPGRWHLTGVFTASSAVFGDRVLGPTSWLKETREWSAWVVPGTAHPFVEGEQAAVNTPDDDEDSHPKLCQTYSIIDGAFTDNTGILQAVSSGVYEVTAFLNNFMLDRWLEPSFENSSEYSVFQENLLHLIETSNESHTLYNVTSVYTEIKFVRVDVTTKENRWFGTKAGNKVRLNLIIISGFLDYTWFLQGPGSNLFGDLVQSLVDTMTAPKHAETVKWALKNFFHVSWPSEWD